MVSDIRLAISLHGHRKRKKLKQVLGLGAFECLIDLWIRVSQVRPNGILNGWSEQDIALEAGWEGDAKQFVDGLIECGWIDKSNGYFKIHDWKEHQPWVYSSEVRVKAAKVAASARWDQRNQAVIKVGNENAIGGTNVDKNDTFINDKNAPLPSPVPEEILTCIDIKKDKPKKTKKNAKAVKTNRLGLVCIEFSREFIEFWTLYPRKENKSYAWDCWKKYEHPLNSQAIIDGLKMNIQHNPQWGTTRYVPHASTFLNQKQWLNPIEEISSSAWEEKSSDGWKEFLK